MEATYPYAIRNQRKASKVSHCDANQWEHSVCQTPDQWHEPTPTLAVAAEEHWQPTSWRGEERTGGRKTGESRRNSGNSEELITMLSWGTLTDISTVCSHVSCWSFTLQYFPRSFLQIFLMVTVARTYKDWNKNRPDQSTQCPRSIPRLEISCWGHQ